MPAATKTASVLEREPSRKFVWRPAQEMQSGASPASSLVQGDLTPGDSKQSPTLVSQSPPASGYCSLREGFEEAAETAGLSFPIRPGEGHSESP